MNDGSPKRFRWLVEKMVQTKTLQIHMQFNRRDILSNGGQHGTTESRLPNTGLSRSSLN